MPAESNHHHDPLDADGVAELIYDILGLDSDEDPERDRTLADLGVDGSLAVYELWDLVAVELGERTVGAFEVDPAELTTDLTVGDLVGFALASFDEPDHLLAGERDATA